MKIGDVVYYARVLHGIFEVCELTIRTVTDTYFVGIDKHDKHAYLLSYSSIGKKVFEDRADALEVVLLEEERYGL